MASLFKQCACTAACRHPWSYRFEWRQKVYRATTSTANRQLAERILERERTRTIERGHGVARVDSPVLSAHIGPYCEWTAKANTTAYKDRKALERFMAVAGDRRLSEYTVFQVERWKTARAKEVLPSTVNRELTIIRACFSKAVQWHKLGASPLDGVKKFRVDDTRTRILSAEEIETVRQQAPAVQWLLMRTTLESLLRLSEVLHLHRQDIGPSWLAVRRKGGKVQRVPATPMLCADLKAAVHRVSGYVFGEGKNGTRPTQQTATNRIIRLFGKLGIADASHHSLRHTGASMMLGAGHSARVVQIIGGWSQLGMLQRYTHPSGSELQAAVATLSQQDASRSAVRTGDQPRAAEATAHGGKT